MIYSDAPQNIRNFLSYKGTIQGRSSNTVSEYYSDLRNFFRFVLKTKYADKYKDTESTVASKRMLDRAGVKYTQLSMDNKKIILNYDIT